MIDPYAKVNERIRQKRRARGRRDDEFDALIRAASQELGATTEAVLGIFLDLVERVGLRYLEEAAATTATRRLRWTPDAVRAVRFATTRLPGAGGRVVSQSSEWAVRTGLSVLRDFRRRLETTRRDMGTTADRPRRRPPRPNGKAPDADRKRPDSNNKGSDRDRKRPDSRA